MLVGSAVLGAAAGAWWGGAGGDGAHGRVSAPHAVEAAPSPAAAGVASTAKRSKGDRTVHATSRAQPRHSPNRLRPSSDRERPSEPVRKVKHLQRAKHVKTAKPGKAKHAK